MASARVIKTVLNLLIRKRLVEFRVQIYERIKNYDLRIGIFCRVSVIILAIVDELGI